jgi:hypothetical protein
MPMFLGVVYDGTTPYFTISRLPYVVTGAASTALWQEGSTDGDAQLDVGILTSSGLTLANWVNLPITQVGWFDATYALTGEAWTFAVTGKNGFNYNYEAEEFNLSSGQNGSESGKVYTSADGATALAFSTVSEAKYKLNRYGVATLIHAHDNQSAAGADASAVRWVGPCAASTDADIEYTLVSSLCTINNVESICTFFTTNGNTYVQGRYVNATTGGSMLDSSFANTADRAYFSGSYPCM